MIQVAQRARNNFGAGFRFESDTRTQTVRNIRSPGIELRTPIASSWHRVLVAKEAKPAFRQRKS